MEEERIIRQFHVPHGSPLANKTINEVSKEFSVSIESLDKDDCTVLEEGSAISVSGTVSKVHTFIEKIFGE